MSDPAESENKLGSLWHLPILRVYAQGSPWVALFFLLTGYVNVLSPIKKAREGNFTGALMSLASSTFRRPLRLILPTTIATLFAWLFCQLGFYSLAASSDAWWMSFTSPLPDETFRVAVSRLLWTSYNVWMTGENDYDKNQWALKLLLKGSLMVFLLLLATIRCTPFWRMSVFASFYCLSWIWNDAMIGLNVYAGALLAELNIHLGSAHAFPRCRGLPMRFLCAVLILIGLYWSSYPETHNGWRTWSANLGWWGLKIFPRGVDQYRFWPALGVQLITISVMLSPHLQHFLSLPSLTWLGTVSFPIYLLHGPLIRSLLAWLLFGLRNPIKKIEHNADGSVKGEYEVLPMPTLPMYIIAIPIFFIALLAVCQLWNLYIEPWCARLTKMAEDLFFGVGRLEVPGNGHVPPPGAGKQNGVLPQ